MVVNSQIGSFVQRAGERQARAPVAIEFSGLKLKLYHVG